MSGPTLSRRSGVALGTLWWAILVFLYAPLAVVVLFSFNDAKFSAEFLGFSLRWYRALWSNDVVLAAIRHSLILGLASASVGTILGTLLGYGLYRYRAAQLAWVSWIVYLPIVIPDIVFGISEAVFFVFIKRNTGYLEAGLDTMCIAHITFITPFVALVVYSRLVGLDRTVFEAVQDLYASPMQRAWAFILPVTWPAIVSGFFLGFTLSIDDFVISFFTSGPSSATLPIFIYSSVKKGVSPEINAVASLLIAMVAVIAITSVVADRLRGRSRRGATT